MKNNLIHPLWPILIGEFHNPNHQKIKKDLIEFFEQYENEHKTSRKGNENFDLFESEYFLHKEKNDVLTKLLSFMAESFMTMASKINKEELDKAENKNPKLTVKFNNSWFIRYNKGGVVVPHDHGGGSMSCVYYVQIGDEPDVNDINNSHNGSTYFMRPYGRGTSHQDFGGIRYNKGASFFKAEEGKMLIWPSFIMHGSKPYLGKENRIVVSANIDVDIAK
ncbi:hypothetical protein IDH16_02115 [Pelagibacterales bacterium SAG-MED45]|nr:hypothetical protein [Pelagibacterales bacterium SAG-MED45]MBD1133663.1 hypothetical protein [Pelagibacterales bacterium SAG-MED44]MBD1139198.1 hypothetical protein [Pelagibacterales bacterium SAG-MED46]